jgi:hypothetical protein
MTTFITLRGLIANLLASFNHTIPTMQGSCIRMAKTNNDGWQRKEYVRPTVIPIYNHGMGGTDSGDQRLETYRPELKTIS